MLTFQQFCEAYFDTYRLWYKNMPDTVVHKNPSGAEMMKMQHHAESKSLRGLLSYEDNGEKNAYFWDASHGMHSDIVDELKKKGITGKFHEIHVGRDHKNAPYVSSEYHTEGTIRAHPFTQQRLAHHRFYSC